MNRIKHLAGAILTAALVATPALAVTETVTFAQFTQRSSNPTSTAKVASYINSGSGNTLTISQAPIYFVVQAFGPLGFYPSTMSLSANTTSQVINAGQQFQQGGYTGSINFGNGSNFLTVSFANATFTFDGNGGSASLLATDPDDTITYTSNLLNLPAFDAKNFSLAFTGITPLFGIDANGFGRAFTANVAGSFAGTADLGGAGAVPEPASWAMLLMGFGMVGYSARRRRTPVTVAS